MLWSVYDGLTFTVYRAVAWLLVSAMMATQVLPAFAAQDAEQSAVPETGVEEQQTESPSEETATSSDAMREEPATEVKKQ